MKGINRLCIIGSVESAFILFCLCLCLSVSFGQFVNPLPIDGWFFTQYRITARLPGWDDFTPIAAPAFFYRFIHLLSVLFRLGFPAELYLASIFQGLLLFLSVILIYFSCKCLDFSTSTVCPEHHKRGSQYPQQENCCFPGGRPHLRGDKNTKTDYVGIFVSLVTLLFIESTLLTQSFWSENVTIFLMSVILYIIVKIYAGPELNTRALCSWGVILGFFIGVLVTTRLTPIIILPGLVFLFKGKLNKKLFRFLLCTITVTVIYILLSMGANYYRVNRFELLNSTGRHLWGAIFQDADIMLQNSSEYAIVKKHIPDIHKKEHWQVDYRLINPHIEAIGGISEGELLALEKEKLLRKLSFQAIRNRPDIFIRLGISKLRNNLKIPPSRLGFVKPMSQDRRLLNTYAFYPSLVPVFGGLRGFLTYCYRKISALYGKVIFFSTYFILAVIFLRLVYKLLMSLLHLFNLKPKITGSMLFIILFVSSQTLLIFWGCFLNYTKFMFFYYMVFFLFLSFFLRIEKREKNKSFFPYFLKINSVMNVPIFLLYVFIFGYYLGLQTETASTRYVLPYLPVLALMASIIIKTFLVFFSYF